MTSCPELEIVSISTAEPFKIWAHGYPYKTVRWHFHPEVELHLITHTRGRYFVGDYIGEFEPGNLVLTGPNLPHNWLSDVPPNVSVPQRCVVLQFTTKFIESCAVLFPALELSPLMSDAQRGLQFSQSASDDIASCMLAMLEANSVSRPALFLRILELLVRADGRRTLASVGYRPRPSVYMTKPINHVLDHIAQNLNFDLRESDLAALSGYNASAFSRAFRRQTGVTFVGYVNGMRIKRSCELLVHSERSITDICYEVGFNNISNFNRRFRAITGFTPSSFRTTHVRGEAFVQRWQTAVQVAV